MATLQVQYSHLWVPNVNFGRYGVDHYNQYIKGLDPTVIALLEDNHHEMYQQT